jgi:hypothetical protein
MAALSEEVKTFIVRRLACFRTPTEAAQEVKEEFGLVVTRQAVRSFNPLQCPVAKKWKAIFEATRKAYLESVADEGVSYQAHRVRELGELYRRAKAKNNIPLAADLLERVARELGGSYTNKSLVDLASLDLSNLSDDQLSLLAKGEDVKKVLASK